MKTLPLLGAITLGLGLLHPAAVQADQTLRCESQGNRYQSCPADTRGGVRLSRQLSSQGCWQGDTWGYDRNRIWVTRGCRAEFRIGERRDDDDTSKVVAGAIVLGVIAAAILAHDKDDDRDRYEPGYGDDHYGSWGGADYTFTCESIKERFTRCRNGYVRGRGHVEVVRQLSRSECRYGDTWGVDRNQVWVDRGCRAEFGVYR